MRLNEILEENTIKGISQKTKISEDNLENLLAANFDALKKIKTLGFISILEREYKADLSALREEALEHYSQGTEENNFTVVIPIEEEKKGKSNLFLFIILALLAYASWYFFTQFDKKHLSELIPFMDEQMIETVVVETDEKKKEIIEHHFAQIMDTLGLDLKDDSLQGTPRRVAKMFVSEIFHGLNPKNKPKMSSFENKYKYGEMLVEKNITLYSTCEHHFLPIVGKEHIAYISKRSVIGLSKMNRIVEYYAKRPQVQERMTMQIVKELQEALGTDDVACIIDAKHLCVNSRGVSDVASSTVTSEYGGQFKNEDIKREFLQYIKLDTDYNGV